MANKNQGRSLNRTLTNFLANADFGAFSTAVVSVVLIGDAARKIRITGFAFNWAMGLVADINPNHLMQVALLEGVEASADSLLSPLPEKNSALSFLFGKTADKFLNHLDRQFESSFRLQDGVTYSLIATMGLGAAIAATTTARLTVFGYEESERGLIGGDRESVYSRPR